jgi:choline dehydrogenase
MNAGTVIVGAGRGGGALAARLTEDPAQRVTLVEAGPDFPRMEDVPEAVADAYEMSVEGQDWGLQAFFLEPPELREPQPYPRGRLVGGSSAVNAAIAQRASVEDFDAWLAGGNDEWSWERVLPYFSRLERDLDYGEEPYHGDAGPIPIMRHQRDEWAASGRAFERACLDRGHPPCPDHNEPGATGIGPIPRNQIGTVRASSLVTYLAEARERPNLTILSDTTCTRVLFEGTRAVGVEIECDGRRERLLADRVVLCAGAIHTPHLLMLSGIGPADVLSRFGIEIVVANEAVGQNLQDHPFAPVLTLLREPTQNVGVRAELKFTTAASGGLKDDMMMFPSVLDPATMNMKDVDTKGLKALTLVSLLAKPRSVGWLTLSSADPHVQPELHVNFLSDPSDIERLMESVRLAYELATTSPLREEIAEILFPDADTVAGDEELEAYILSVASTSYHASCTCRMGPAGDPGAVVSQRLAVHGTECLFVADASVFPNVPTGLTNLTAYMTGERLAEWLLNPAASAA